ncbi:TIGR03862 family flavoprotein [Actibacterium sp. XHP0104]|uniref:TIGR03862 family flavoprotein n=1 Tax=Actibacterium sp. XHP0104 TaxID=2984335 RepID=UPI0021E6E349|nr:TIGR03862 family flavoprotein [Actibacterium sp. XHP0104]MCV2881971.1 TIGR03862 family flavoprotein [Actibacterium sp. XHP0104]
MSAQVLIIGAGPAGLMAADVLSAAGARVTLAEAKPSVGRKFLMAGKSGLNLTKDEPLPNFVAAYGPEGSHLRPMLTAFGPEQVRDWARGLGQEVFTGSSGRVFPSVMKASPLLRAWMGRLAAQGVRVETRWKWRSWAGTETVFDTPAGEIHLTPDATILALGGASWARLGSDGAWVEALRDHSPLAPFQPANMGFVVPWSDPMRKQFGQPVKGTELIAGARRVRAEYVISARGLEGGGIYAVSRDLREGADLAIDLMPDWPADKIAARLARPRGKASLGNHLRKALGLDPVRLALLLEFGRPLPEGADLAGLVKHLPVHHAGPRPIDEAISTAGGVMWDGLTPGLELRDKPGVWCAGEMLDWEAPTGGYLLTACLATGRWAAQDVARAIMR